MPIIRSVTAGDNPAGSPEPDPTSKVLLARPNVHPNDADQLVSRGDAVEIKSLRESIRQIARMRHFVA
jgi:hypothetical protein